MGKFLIAVGGTGQEIALACLRLCYMAGDGAAAPLISIFDADHFTETEAKKDTRAAELNKVLTHIAEYRGRQTVESTFLPVYQAPKAPDGTDQDVQYLRDLFAEHGGLDEDAGSALHLLLTDEQQKTRITEGFHGRPTVGAYAFGDFKVRGGLTNFYNTLWHQNILQKSQEPHFVVLAGGTGGGTGTGVLPVLAREAFGFVSNRRKQPNVKPIELSLLLQIPWFALRATDDPSAGQSEQGSNDQETKHDDIDNDEMRTNSASLVRFYANELQGLADRMALLGLEEPIDRLSQGPNRQMETHHYLNVISGWLTAELLCQSPYLAPLAPTAGVGLPMFGITLTDGKPATGKLLLSEVLKGLNLTTDANGQGSIPLKRAV